MRPWPGTDETLWKSTLLEIQSRILSAADVAIDGHLAEKYPDSVGRRIRIRVDSPSGCPVQLQTLIKAVGRFLREDPSYSEAIRSSDHIEDIRLVTGHEMGRFGQSN